MPRHSHKLIIAIDGPAGSGKSSTAKALALKLHLPYIDTGAMYRAVTLKVMRERVPFDNKKALIALSKQSKIELSGPIDSQRVLLDGEDVTKAIREPELTKNVFYVAQESQIRSEMVKKQRLMAKKSGAVMEGRDIGTVVFPDADYKFYFEANLRIRAKRRIKDLKELGVEEARHAGSAMLAKMSRDIRERDRHDKTRSEGPLKKAKDAFCIDTSSLTIEETVDRIVKLIRSKPLKSHRLSG